LLACAYFIRGDEAVPKPTRVIPRLSDNRVIAPTQTALALNLVSPMDLLRLKSIARLHARGLPPAVAWDDMLQEAITRVLTGARVKPEDISMVAFLGGIMRSLRADYFRRAGNDSKGEDSRDHEVVDPAADPERALIATETLGEIRLLFAEDALVLHIIEGLAEGRTAEQIRARHGITRTDYDTARKRMRRCLIREGLTCART
jgi:DNA-directed RNA polymerase specialized sigma24 family protein